MKITLCMLCLLVINPCYAVGERHGPRAIEVRVETGTKDGEMVFVPDTLEFERGKYYKLVLHNPSNSDHYFSSDGFVTHIHTTKVEVMGADNTTLAEIHGDVHDIELKPGTTLEWFFYPMRNGENMLLRCHKNDHEQRGMIGRISISGPPPFSN